MPPAFPAALVDVHRRNNRATIDAWEPFAEHRARVTALVRAAGEVKPGSLLVLGAGNCNDLDLVALASPLRKIHLADVDAAALARAEARQPAVLKGALTLHAPVDLSGALKRLAVWARERPTSAQIENLAASSADNVVAALPGPHATVLSSGLLTQILHSARGALGASHDSLRAIAAGLVVGHLAALARLTAAGGTALLVTDVVSSESYPLEELWGTRDPLALLGEISASGNSFTGADPSFILRLLHEHPLVAPLIGSARLLPPWLWKISDEVTMLVYAIELRRDRLDSEPR